MDLNQIIDNMRDDIVNSTQKLINIKSIKSDPSEGKPFGQEIDDALMYMLELSQKLGFSTKNLDGYAGYAEFGQGNKLIGVLTHLDVVPEGDSWTSPPFSGKISANKIFGRGAIDDKCPTIAALYALKALKESGISLDSRVRIIFGLDEESGSACMKYYVDNEEIPTCSFVPDAGFPVINSEKGILTFKLEKGLKKGHKGLVVSILGGSRHNVVPDFCEATVKIPSSELAERIKQKFIDFFNKTQFDMEIDHSSEKLLIKSYGVSSHASLPDKGKNAISQLMTFLKELDLEGDLRSFVDFFSKYIGMEYTGQSLGINYHDETTGSLTMNVGIINLNLDKVELTLDIRYPVTHKSEDILRKVEENVKPYSITISNISDNKPLFVPPESDLVRKLMEAYTDFTGERTKPVSIGGGTYARSMPNAVAFGPVFPGEPELAHQKDEYIDIDNLIKITKIYAHAIQKLAQ